MASSNAVTRLSIEKPVVKVTLPNLRKFSGPQQHVIRHRRREKLRLFRLLTNLRWLPHRMFAVSLAYFLGSVSVLIIGELLERSLPYSADFPHMRQTYHWWTASAPIVNNRSIIRSCSTLLAYLCQPVRTVQRRACCKNQADRAESRTERCRRRYQSAPGLVIARSEPGKQVWERRVARRYLPSVADVSGRTA